MFLRRLFISFCMFSLSLAPLYSQSEDELDKMLLDSPTKTSNESTEKEKENPWKVFGFIENNNHIATPYNRTASEYEIIKLEGRVRIHTTYISDTWHAKVVGDAFFYPEVSTISEDDTRDALEAQEIHIGGGDTFRFKLGKQIFNWGSADAFTVTNPMSQRDLRQFLAVDRDDRNRGIYALSLKYIIGEYALEGAVTPMHNRALIPQGFWAMDPGSQGTLSASIDRDTQEESDLSQSGASLRFGGREGDLDWHIVYYTGNNDILVFKPDLTGTAASNASISLAPYYNRVHSIGLDSAFTLDKLNIRAEVSYIYDMPGVSKVDSSSLPSAIGQLDASGGASIPDISPVEKSHYGVYVIGADYNLWGDNGTILVEWYQGMYLHNRDDYQEPLLNKMLLIRIEDKLLSERLEMELSVTCRPVQSSPGGALAYEAGWNFQNGLVISMGGYTFRGNEDDLFEKFEDKDMAFLKAKFEF